MKAKHSNLFGTIADFINVLCSDMLNRGKEELGANLMPEVSLNTSTSSVSSITVHQVVQGHTREYLKNKRQVRCIWCNRVDLVEKKTTMKCVECGYGFCRQGACWSHHVAMGGVPRAPKKGTKKRMCWRKPQGPCITRVVRGWGSQRGSYPSFGVQERWTTTPFGGRTHVICFLLTIEVVFHKIGSVCLSYF